MEISNSKNRHSTEKIILWYKSVTSFCTKWKIKNPRAQSHVLKVTTVTLGIHSDSERRSCRRHREERGLLSRTSRQQVLWPLFYLLSPGPTLALHLPEKTGLLQIKVCIWLVFGIKKYVFISRLQFCWKQPSLGLRGLTMKFGEIKPRFTWMPTQCVGNKNRAHKWDTENSTESASCVLGTEHFPKELHNSL